MGLRSSSTIHPLVIYSAAVHVRSSYGTLLVIRWSVKLGQQCDVGPPSLSHMDLVISEAENSIRTMQQQIVMLQLLPHR